MDPEFESRVKEADLVHLILGYFDEAGLPKSLLALEEETGVTNGNWEPHSDIAFIRRSVITGKWDDLLHFLRPLSRNKATRENSRRLSMIIEKQRLLEYLCTTDGDSPRGKRRTMTMVDSEFVKVWAEIQLCLERLEKLCSAEQFASIQKLVDMGDFRQVTEQLRWCPRRGRLDSFKEILAQYEEAMGIRHPSRPKLSGKKDSPGFARGKEQGRLIILTVLGKFYEQLQESFQQRRSETFKSNDRRLVEKCPGVLQWLKPVRMGPTEVRHWHKFVLNCDLANWMSWLPDKFFEELYHRRTKRDHSVTIQPICSTDGHLNPPIKRLHLSHGTTGQDSESKPRKKATAVVSRGHRRSVIPGSEFSFEHTATTQDPGHTHASNTPDSVLSSTSEESSSKESAYHCMSQDTTGTYTDGQDPVSLPASSTNPHTAAAAAALPVIKDDPTNNPASTQQMEDRMAWDAYAKHRYGVTSGIFHDCDALDKAFAAQRQRESTRKRPATKKHTATDSKPSRVPFGKHYVALGTPRRQPIPPRDWRIKMNERPPPVNKIEPLNVLHLPRYAEKMSIEVSRNKDNAAVGLPNVKFLEVGQIPGNAMMRAIGFSPRNDLFAVGTNGGDVHVFVLRKRAGYALDAMGRRRDPTAIREVLKHHDGVIYDLQFSNCGRFIATCSNDKTVKLAKLRHSDRSLLPWPECKDVVTHTDVVRAVKFFLPTSNAGDPCLASCSIDTPTVLLSNIGTQQQLGVLQVNTADQRGFIAMDATPDHPVLWCATYRELFMFDMRKDWKPAIHVRPSRASLCTFPEKPAPFISCLSSGKDLVSLGFCSGHCAFLDLRSMSWVGPVRIHDDHCRSVGLSRKYNCALMSAGFDGRVCMTDIYRRPHEMTWKWEMQDVVTKHPGKIISACWSGNEEFAMTASTDKIVRLWQTSGHLDF
ncbi:WD repeat-containing protein 47-like [Sycon ciliatum]|uniref:WD repeat-containing protein 47-like n=1 Tax=Sycon ciliatum TaxID=27933 RepID=UPI0031F69C32